MNTPEIYYEWPPEIYYEWAKLLNIFKEGNNDAEALKVLEQGTIVQQTGVYERLIQRIANVINARFQKATTAFANALAHSSGDNFEMSMSQALGNLAKEMELMPKLASLPALRDKDKQTLNQIIQEQINRIGTNLVRDAKADRTGKMASILKSKGFKV